MADETRSLIAAGIAELTQAATLPVEPFGYGRDLVCWEDLTATLAETDPATTQSLAQDVYHRITTERGSLVDDPDYGEDVRGYVNEAMTERGLLSIGGRLSQEIRKDDRIGSVEVIPELQLVSPITLGLTLAITPEDPALQPFTMILAVTSAEAILKAIT